MHAQTERERRRKKRREKKRKKSEGGRQRRTEAKRGKERENAKRKREREVADVKNVLGSSSPSWTNAGSSLLTEEDLMWLRLWNVRQDLTKATDEWKHTRSILGDMKKCKSEYSGVLLEEDHAAEKASKLEALKESQDIAPYIRVIV